MDLININVILNLVLALIMLGLGFSLRIQDFRNLFNNLRALFIGLFAQIVLLPLIAFFICSITHLSNELKVGIMILSFCPGGITSNLVSYFVKANVALGISLTVFNALISLISIPFLTNITLQYFLSKEVHVQLPFWTTMMDIFIVTILPAALGVLCRNYFEKPVIKIEKYLNIVLPFLLGLVFLFKFLADKNNGGTGMSLRDIGSLWNWVILLNALSMLLGYFCGVLFKLNHQDRLTSAIEVGLHNTALALLIAGEKLNNPTMEKPALVYAMFSFFITFGIAYLIQFFRKRIHKIR